MVLINTGLFINTGIYLFRIQSKEAEAQLLKAEKSAAEAFEAATAMGVIIYDIPNCPKKPCQIETSSGNGGGSTTHKVTASFETAFEVDIEVAAAVKTALVRLASCASFNKDEFNELLRKISQNPDTGENTQELSEFSSEHESESGSELETASQDDGLSSQEIDSKLPVPEIKQRTKRKRLSFERFNMTKLVEMMLERLRRLQEDELSSLATIVATSGLNAVLAEVQNSKLNDPGSADYSSTAALNFPRRLSSAGAGNLESFTDSHIRRKQAESELPSLDKFLVKHVTKLEREVQEAKNSRRNESREGIGGKVHLDNNVTSFETIPDLGSILLKHSSKLEKEIEEAKKNSGGDFGMNSKNLHSQRTSSEAVPDLGTILIKHSSKLEKEIEETKRNNRKKIEVKGKKLGGVPEVPSLDKFLVKHVSRLEKEVQEAKIRRKNESHKEGRVNYNKMAKVDSSSVAQFDKTANSDGGEEKENINLNEIPTISKMEQEECNVDTGEASLEIGQVNLKAGESLSVQCKKSETKETDNSLDKILVKPVHRLERYKIQALSSGSNFESHCHTKKQPGKSTDCESLDKVLVKHVSRLEKEKMALGLKEEVVKVRVSETKMHSQMNQEGGLDQILVKHKSRLEREKMVAAQQPDDQIRHSVTRREARDKELQEAWGGLSLGNTMRPHQSKLQRDKVIQLLLFFLNEMLANPWNYDLH